MRRPYNQLKNSFALIAGILVVLFAGCRPRAASPGLELQKEDYRAARSSFHTRLVRHGPAPQQWQPMHALTGVQQVEYRRNPRCSAWLTSAPADGQPATTKRPAVLFLHGGVSMGDDDWDMARPFQDAGFSVMEPALGGENGQEGDYTMFYDEVEDVRAAADYLSRLPNVDSKRIFVAGH